MKNKVNIIDSLIVESILRNEVIIIIGMQIIYNVKNAFLPPFNSSFVTLANKYPIGKAKIIIKIESITFNIRLIEK
jgi:hypothetical protein